LNTWNGIMKNSAPAGMTVSLITLDREILTRHSTIGRLSVFGKEILILEDTKRSHKVWGETRIPAGRYRLGIRVRSQMSDRYFKRFPDMHKGMIWLKDVPGFDWVYIHPGNSPGDTLGCLLTGSANPKPNWVSGSVQAYIKVYDPIIKAIRQGGCEIQINDET